MRYSLALVLAVSFPVLSHAQRLDSAFMGQLGAARQAVLAQKAATVFSWQQVDILIGRLGDPDPMVRIEALKALRDHVGQSNRVWLSVLNVLNNRNELVEVRYQAIKTLSRVTNYPQVAQTLERYATDPTAPPAFRAISYKALYGQAAGNPQVRSMLMRGLTAAEPSPEGMMGAIWALGQASHYPEVAQALMRVATVHPNMAIRVEAVRSLYRGMSRPEVRMAIARTAGNALTDPALRYPAILALSAVQTPQHTLVLQNIAQRDPNPLLRQAAIMAMDPYDSRIQAYFHMPVITSDGRIVDPLENE